MCGYAHESSEGVGIPVEAAVYRGPLQRINAASLVQ
jgi:hypothetical protein